MANPAKVKGDRAEREAAELFSTLTGHTLRRELGAGRLDDQGDIDGLPDCALQVVHWADVSAAIRQKPLGAERQRLNRGARWAATLVRLRGKMWRVILTPEQFAALYADALRGRESP